MILWADGFDGYGNDESKMLDGLWAEQNVTLSNTQARTGTYSMYVAGVNDKARRVLGGNKTVVGVAMAIFAEFQPTAPAASNIVSFRDSNNYPQVLVNLDTTGAISAWQGDRATNYGHLLGVSTDLMVTNAWNHIEVRADFGAGDLEVRLNGVTVLNLAGVDLVNANPQPLEATGQTSAAQITLGFAGTSGHSNYYLDDLVVWDDSGSSNNTFVGDRKVFTDVPTSDTAEQDWTRSSGSSSYSLLDEIPDDGDGTYLTTDTTGDRFGVGFGALPDNVTNIAAVIFIHKSRKTDAGDCNVQLHLDSGVSEADGASRPMTTAYTCWFDVFEVDPATSAPFTKSAAEAATLVVERTL